MGRRENTIRIDFAHFPKPLSFEEVHNFMDQKLCLRREDVCQIQPNKRLGCMFVKVVDPSLPEKLVLEHSNKHTLVVDNKPYTVRIAIEDGAVEVRIFDLTEDVTNQQIIDFLSAYGEVLSVRELVWDEKYKYGGIRSGIRSARVIIYENIPSLVTIGGEETTLNYRGQKQTCLHCREFAHAGIPCVQNKRLLVQKTAADLRPTYATMLANPAKKQNTNTNATSKPLPSRMTTLNTTTNSAATARYHLHICHHHRDNCHHHYNCCHHYTCCHTKYENCYPKKHVYHQILPI